MPHDNSRPPARRKPTPAETESAANSPDPAADPGTNRTHPEPNRDADLRRNAGGEKYEEKSPHTAGQQ